MSEDVDDPVTTLFSAFDAVQTSLRDIQAFWEHHVGFLSLLVNRQTNFPVPGEEAKATFELWTRCQTALLQSSSSISESADAMSVEPVATPLTRYPTRRITHPIPVTPNEVLATVITPSGNLNKNAEKLPKMNFYYNQTSDGESASDLLVDSQLILIGIIAS